MSQSIENFLHVIGKIISSDSRKGQKLTIKLLGKDKNQREFRFKPNGCYSINDIYGIMYYRDIDAMIDAVIRKIIKITLDGHIQICVIKLAYAAQHGPMMKSIVPELEMNFKSISEVVHLNCRVVDSSLSHSCSH